MFSWCNFKNWCRPESCVINLIQLFSSPLVILNCEEGNAVVEQQMILHVLHNIGVFL